MGKPWPTGPATASTADQKPLHSPLIPGLSVVDMHLRPAAAFQPGAPHGEGSYSEAYVVGPGAYCVPCRPLGGLHSRESVPVDIQKPR